MWGALIGAAVGIGSSIIGGRAAATERRKVRRNIENALAENEREYQRTYNEDYTQRADAQRLLEQTRSAVVKSNRAAEGRQAVTGGTDASRQTQRQNNASAVAQTMGNIASQAANYKERARNKYNTRKDSYNAQLNSYQAATAQNITDAASQVGNIAATAGAAYDQERLIAKYGVNVLPTTTNTTTSGMVTTGTSAV